MTKPLVPLLALLALAACRATPDSAAPPRTSATLPGYTLVLLKTGPQSGKLSKEENDAAFAGHFSNMERMANEHQLLVAGPFGTQRHDPALRGLFVLASAERAEAESWAGTDPTTLAGVFTLEFHELATAAPLRQALERELARNARLRAEGQTPAPADGVRPYVLLIAEHGDLAQRELTPLLNPDGGVFLLATLDGTRALALLDATNQAEAAERFEPQLAVLGSHTLDEWFATAELVNLVAAQGN
jgi:uncharacterized protein YciI